MIIFLQATLIIWTLVTLLWLLSVYLKNVSIVDIFWGFGFVVVNAFYFFLNDEPNIRQQLLLALVSIWGLRLTIYLAIRNIGKPEDYRYQQFRKDYGENRYWWFSYFQVFLLQGALILMVALPLWHIQTTSSADLNWLDYLAILLWIIGFAFEAGGDYQLYHFKKNPANRGKVLNTGFWKFTRHPNYFGDAAIWWSYALFCLAAGGSWHILGSILMTWLIVKISGVAMLERTLKTSKPQYKEYIEKTNAFLPWFPKK